MSQTDQRKIISTKMTAYRRLCVMLISTFALTCLSNHVDAQATPKWTNIRVAEEGQSFTTEGKQIIRFGADIYWIEKEVLGSARCTNEFFGKDPVVGIKKSCELATDRGTPMPPTREQHPAVVNRDPPVPDRIADEGQTFTLQGSQNIRYGNNNDWIEKRVTGMGQCNNTFFGHDPAPNSKKWCETAKNQKVVRSSSSGTSMNRPPATPKPVQPRAIAPSGPMPAPVSWGKPRASARFFVSGHSLTDDPYANDIVNIAKKLAGPVAVNYNQQIVIGSPIRVRTGMPHNLDGYSTGKNRPYGEGLNIQREFLIGSTINGERYDSLIITENHNLIQNLQWEMTVKQTRHFHEKLISGNPQAQTFFHASWWEIDKNDPGSWLEAERAMAPAWQCVTSRINQSLAMEGRQDRTYPLPTSLALVDLVERALNGQLPGISANIQRVVLDRIFSDSVHLTRLGSYYLSLVTFAAIYQRSPEGALPAEGVTREQAAILQSLAWSFVTNFYANYKEPSLAECNTRLMPPACEHYWKERKRTHYIEGCKGLFHSTNRENPFYYNAATDMQFWYPEKP